MMYPTNVGKIYRISSNNIILPFFLLVSILENVFLNMLLLEMQE